MVKRIVLLLVLIAVVAVAGVWAYQRYRTNLRYSGGEVTTLNGSEPVRTNSRSETAASRSNWDDPKQDGQVQPGQVQESQVQPGDVRTSVSNDLHRMGAEVRRAGNGETDQRDTMAIDDRGSFQGSAAPSFDTQNRNAPNGVALATSGKFQVYRQGDLTWRVNTENGSSCVLFATLEQWRKPLVYRHTCPDRN